MTGAFITGIRPVDGTNKKTNQSYHFYEVCAQPAKQDERAIGTLFGTFSLSDEELADDLKHRLREAIKSGNRFVDAEIYSHYSNGRNYIDYIKYPESN